MIIPSQWQKNIYLLQAKWSLKSSKTEWAEKVITEVEFKDSKVRKKNKDFDMIILVESHYPGQTDFKA